ncbi:MAG TPA: transglycosylase domain-containing protein [Cyclobacteriaceae bacterium]|nr:transglycosylase domain-containing protein [Cyclobacteriaceae bacterium]
MNIHLRSRIDSVSTKILDYVRNLTFKKVIVLWGKISGLILALLLLIFVSTWLGIFGSIPSKEELLEIKNPIASEVYSADSVLLGRYFYQERSDVTFEEIPKHVIDAVIVIEDARFFDHHGIDFRSFGRVIIKSILFQQESSGGGSTISQQLAKNLYPRKNYWFFSLLINKIRETIIAARLEDVYDKETILSLYLNTVPFGDNTFGIEAAAQRFFSIPAKELSINQAALLVGMLKANHVYNPRINPQQALQRRNVVLAQLEKYEILEADLVDSLQALPIELRYHKITHHTGLAPYFREFLRSYLLQWCEDYNTTHDEKINLYTAGLKIYTTIDSRFQHYAENAMEHQMASIQKVFLKHCGKNNPWEEYRGMIDEIISKSGRYQNLSQQGLSREEIMAEMNKPVSMNIFSWDGEKQVMMSPVDSIKYYLKFLNTGLLALDPSQGAVRAWVGGINHHYFQFDHVRESTKRQVGSVIKPIVYAAALEQGLRPCSFISAEKTTYTNMEDWAPKNSSEDNYGLKYSMPGALAYSVNTVSVRVLEKTGIENTITVARNMGITSPLKPVPSLALGTPEISMMEIVQAYTCFANEGKLVKSFFITSIASREKEVLEKFEPSDSLEAISAESASLMLHMLRRAVNEGTSASLRTEFNLPNDIAGKTGTTQSNTDGWFVAITPKLVIGAWVGADDPRIRFCSTALGQGAKTALPIVAEFLQLSNQDHTLDSITQAQFPELSVSLENKIDCDLFRNDNKVFKRIFKKSDGEKKKEFGKEEKGFLKRLFRN